MPLYHFLIRSPAVLRHEIRLACQYPITGFWWLKATLELLYRGALRGNAQCARRADSARQPSASCNQKLLKPHQLTVDLVGPTNDSQMEQNKRHIFRVLEAEHHTAHMLGNEEDTYGIKGISNACASKEQFFLASGTCCPSIHVASTKLYNWLL